MRRGESPSLTAETAARDNPANQNGQAEKEAEAVEALEVHPEGKQNKGNVTGPEQSGFFSILIFQSILLSSAEEPQERRSEGKAKNGRGRADQYLHFRFRAGVTSAGQERARAESPSFHTAVCTVQARRMPAVICLQTPAGHCLIS